MFQKRMIALLAAAIMLLLCSAILLPAKDNPMGIREKETITFYEPTVVAGTLLPAGQYQTTHEMQGQTHIMIFKQVNGTITVQAKCNLVPLNGKAQQSEQRYVENAKNQKVLVEMTFRGDTAKHVLEQ